MSSEAPSAQPTDTEALERVRQPRADLRAAMVALEDAAASPATAPLEPWALRVHDALVDLSGAFERHIAATEGPDGLLERVQRAAPRLAREVTRLSEEHTTLRETITATLDTARGAARATDGEAASEVRDAVTELIATVSRHRQAGSDLIYEAYEVDIGAGD